MKLDHFVILARSLEASLLWYSTLLEALGFTKTRDHVWLNADGIAIDLREAKNGTADYERYAPGLNHIGFTAGDECDMHRVRDVMCEAGFDVPEVQSFGEQGIATFLRDPDGMRIEISVYA